ncbi:MAG: hypothetical protein PHU14_04220 [Methylovulum sp.]|nr:hypothetical protein [Methylovulum sp.]
MNPSQLKCLSVFAVFAIIGFGPVSPGCLIGMSIVIMRPAWFWALTNNVYAQRPLPILTPATALHTRQARIKCGLSLLALFIIDIAPVPVTPVIAFAIILTRPLWFFKTVAGVYGKC